MIIVHVAPGEPTVQQDLVCHGHDCLRGRRAEPRCLTEQLAITPAGRGGSASQEIGNDGAEAATDRRRFSPPSPTCAEQRHEEEKVHADQDRAGYIDQEYVPPEGLTREQVDALRARSGTNLLLLPEVVGHGCNGWGCRTRTGTNAASVTPDVRFPALGLCYVAA